MQSSASAAQAPSETLKTIYDAAGQVACTLSAHNASRVVTMEMRNMTRVAQPTMQEFLALIGKLIASSAPRDRADPDSGTTLVFDATQLKNVNVFDFVPALKQWAEKNAKITEATVRCTFIQVSTKEWRDIFSVLLKMFKHTRPVHVVTKLELDPHTRRPRIPPDALQRKQAQRAQLEEQRRRALQRP